MLGTVGGAVGGAYLGDGIQDGTVFGGLTGLGEKGNSDASTIAVRYIDSINTAINAGNANSAESYVGSVQTYAQSAGASSEAISRAVSSVNSWIASQKAIDAGAATNATDAQKSAATTAQNNIAAQKTQAQTDLELLKTECENGTSGTTAKNQWLGPTLGAVLTGAAGGFLLNKATRDIQASNLSAAEKAAYEEWMDSVGQHIKCYIGTDEAGEYGDVLSVSME